MKISAAEVKKLRELTGCPMMDCKKALTECGGDVELAQEALRKKGIASAEKRSARSTAEGRIAGFVTDDGHRLALVELNCETDFVAKNDAFKALAEKVAQAAVEPDESPADTASLLAFTPQGAGKPVEELIKEQYQTLKENMNLRRIVRFDVDKDQAGLLGMYIHFNGKIGTAVELTLSDGGLSGNEEVRTLLKDLCMHVAHSAPIGLSREDIPQDLVEKERAVLSELDEVKKKPEKIRPKIVEGKLSKFFQEKSLLEQEFVKEKKTSIKKVLKRVAGAVGGDIGIARFMRLEIGGE